MQSVSKPISNYSYFQLCLMMLAAAAMIAMPDIALAQDTIGETLCNIVGFINGRIGRAIATIAIIIVGVGALMGKISWGMAIIVGIGVAIVFGASSIVDELSDDADGDCA